MIAEELIKEIQSLSHKGIHFIGRVDRNNSRNKELSFTLKHFGPHVTFEDAGSSRGSAKILIEIDAVLDNKTGKARWNYIDPKMEDKACAIIVDTLRRINLHDRLVALFETDNKLKIEYESI